MKHILRTIEIPKYSIKTKLGRGMEELTSQQYVQLHAYRITWIGY